MEKLSSLYFNHFDINNIVVNGLTLKVAEKNTSFPQVKNRIRITEFKVLTEVLFDDEF